MAVRMSVPSLLWPVVIPLHPSVRPTGCPTSAQGNESERPLYTVLEQRAAPIAPGTLLGTDHVYVIPGQEKGGAAGGAPGAAQLRKGIPGGAKWVGHPSSPAGSCAAEPSQPLFL